MKSIARKWSEVVMALVLLAPVSAAAGAKGAAGGSAAQFLKIGVGARALSLGSAYAAVSGDAHALYWNPAGAAHFERGQVASSYNLLYQDTSQGFMAYVHPIGKGVWGGGVNYLQVADIEKRAGDTAQPVTTLSARDSALFLSYARPRFWGNASLGLTVKKLSLSVDGKSAGAFAADIGLQREVPGSPVALGVSVLNVGPGVKLGTKTDPLPLGVKAGMTYTLFRGNLLLAAGADSWPREKLTYVDMGLEWKPLSAVSLRAGPQMGGYRNDLGSLVGMSAGVGFQLGSLDVDYAYVPFGDLGSTNRLSLRYNF